MKQFLPGIEDRTLVIGRTGSGKTYAGLFLLSEMPIDDMPWVIVDYKHDKNIARIPYAHYIGFETIPTQPGVYILQPMPTQDAEISDYFLKVWETEGIGLYIDEGVMVAKNDALDMILIQGRSKHIPVIMLTQRPVGISRFAFSESGRTMVFPSHDRRERKIISEFTPLFQSRNLEDDLLPPYHSYFYNVTENEVITLKPVPSIEHILATFEEKLRPSEELNESIPQTLPGVVRFQAI